MSYLQKQQTVTEHLYETNPLLDISACSISVIDHGNTPMWLGYNLISVLFLTSHDIRSYTNDSTLLGTVLFQSQAGSVWVMY